MTAPYSDLPAARRDRAIARARTVIEELARLGVTTQIIGSLAAGQFGLHSDVDFLIIDTPDFLRYAIEWRVEDIMGDIPFDVIYLDEVPDWKRGKFISMASDASQLR
jgi:predicted nucleotidyltransferase